MSTRWSRWPRSSRASSASSARDADGLGITVSYWERRGDRELARERGIASQATGRAKWYDEFITRVAKVERVNPRFTRKR
jgi:hypothetical protein